MNKETNVTPTSRSRRRRLAMGTAVLAASIVGGAAGLAALAPGAGAVTGTVLNANFDISPTNALPATLTPVTIAVTETSPDLFKVEAHLCQGGVGINNGFDFSLVDGPYCTPTATAAGASTRVFQELAPDATGATLTFQVAPGQGQPWTDIDGNSHQLQCDATHLCDIVVEIQTSAGSGRGYFTAPLRFATAPGAPTGVSAIGDFPNPGSGKLNVSWTAPTDTGNAPLDQYAVTATGPGGPFTTSVPATQTTAQLSGLTDGESYSVTVTARNTAVDGSHFTSAASSAAIGVPEGPPPATAPSAPRNLAGTPGNTTAGLTWQAPSSDGGSALTGYTVTRSGGPEGTVTTNVPAAQTSLNVTGLTNGTAYTFTVTASNSVGVSPASNAVTVTPVEPPPPPANPLVALINAVLKLLGLRR